MMLTDPFTPFLFLRRGAKWTIVYFDHGIGKKRQRATKYRTDEEAKAKQLLAEFIRKRAARLKIEAGDDDRGPLTVVRWAREWLATRSARGISTVNDYRSRLDLHVLPVIGALRLDAVTPAHIGEVMAAVAAKGLASRTCRHVYFTMHAMFRKAVPRLLEINPCAIDEEDLPRKEDADPEWRETAIFTRREVVQILTDERIPRDRRVFYAIMFLSGCRFGEIAALRLRHYASELEPLGRLQVARSYNTKKKLVKGVKTDKPRRVPVHPWLAAILGDWLPDGWAELMGHEPGPEDLIVPSRRGRNRSVNHMLKKFHQDLERIGLRQRRQHDSRRTFITLARADGARKDILRLVTHGPEGDILDIYSEMPWQPLCEAVMALRIGPEATSDRPALLASKAAELLDARLPSGCHQQIPEGVPAVLVRGGRDLNPRPPA